jgi:hypothetical protein
MLIKSADDPAFTLETPTATKNGFITLFGSNGNHSGKVEEATPGLSTTYAKCHHFAFSQVRRNPIVDIDSTAPEVHNHMYARRPKKMKINSNFVKQRYSHGVNSATR